MYPVVLEVRRAAGCLVGLTMALFPRVVPGQRSPENHRVGRSLGAVPSGARCPAGPPSRCFRALWTAATLTSSGGGRRGLRPGHRLPAGNQPASARGRGASERMPRTTQRVRNREARGRRDMGSKGELRLHTRCFSSGTGRLGPLNGTAIRQMCPAVERRGALRPRPRRVRRTTRRTGKVRPSPSRLADRRCAEHHSHVGHTAPKHARVSKFDGPPRARKISGARQDDSGRHETRSRPSQLQMLVAPDTDTFKKRKTGAARVVIRFFCPRSLFASAAKYAAARPARLRREMASCDRGASKRIHQLRKRADGQNRRIDRVAAFGRRD